MWNPMIRPYGEMFFNGLVKWDAASPSPVRRLDQSQGGTAVCVAVSPGKQVVVAPGKYILLTLGIFKTEAEALAAIASGSNASEYALMMQYMNTGAVNKVFESEEPVMRISLSERLFDYPYVIVDGIVANTETDGSFGSGSVDIFPHYVSAPRRY